MNKKDLPIIVLLFAMLMLWPTLYKKVFPKPQVSQSPIASTNGVPAEVGTETQGSEAAAPAPTAPQTTETGPSVPAEITSASEMQELAPAEAAQHAGSKPQLETIENDVLRITVSSWGGSIESAELKEFPQSNTVDSLPIKMDFADSPAFAYEGISGLSVNHDFMLANNGSSMSISRQVSPSLTFTRTISFTNDYEVIISDSLENSGSEVLSVPKHSLSIGRMTKLESGGSARIAYLGIDTLEQHGGKDVVHWERKGNLTKEFGNSGGFGCFRPAATVRMPMTTSIDMHTDIAWLAVKNKFFTQIVSGSETDPAENVVLKGRRAVSEQELADPDNPAFWPRAAALEEVSASIEYPALSIAQGESPLHTFNYYIGPKKYARLKAMGKGEIMQFGFWHHVCKILLPALNGIYKVVPNYGVAIILLTIAMRILFWPIMKKSTDSMKKMKDIQPELAALKEKFGDDHAKFAKKQQELFKEKGVSPLGGCLPLLIQIPVFIGLFTVLKSAVELRFASFLWIADLSEPEGLLQGILPWPPWPPSGLNLLPILMCITMVWQQRLTPTAGDPQQQKMMAIMMPTMMLFMFYNMAAALVLYWTTSQCLGILQLVLKKKADDKAAAG